MGHRNKDLRKIKKNTKAYWEEVLAREGLGLDAGRDPGHRKLIYVGNSQDIDKLRDMSMSDEMECAGGKRVNPHELSE